MLKWIVTIFCLCLGHNLLAGDDPAYPVGPAFSPHKPQMSAAMVDPKWLQQPVQYIRSLADKDVVVAMDQHLYGALKPLVEKWQKKTGHKVSYSDGSCGISHDKLYKKQADITGYCCPPSIADRLPGAVFHTLGIAPVAIIVHRDNPIESLTAQQIRDLFAGKITHWQQLHPEYRHRVQPIARLHCKKRPGHWRLILNSEDDFSHDLITVGEIANMMDRVSRDPRAIGFAGAYMVDLYADRSPVKMLKIDGVSVADTRALAQARYPFYRTYNITTWQGVGANLKAQQLRDYIFQHLSQIEPRYYMATREMLVQNQWVFSEDELMAEPVHRGGRGK